MTPQERDQYLNDLAEGYNTFKNIAKYIYSVATWISAVGGAAAIIGYALRHMVGG